MTLYQSEKWQYTPKHPAIIVPVVQENASHVIQDMKKMEENQVPVVEWRVDALASYGQEEIIDLLESVREIYHGFLLFTMRTKMHGGTDLSDNEYFSLAKKVMRTGWIDGLDVEYGKDDEQTNRLLSLCKEHETLSIYSYHQFEYTPDSASILRRLESMSTIPADIIKVAYMPKTREDVDSLQQAMDAFNHDDQRSCIAISMGEKGKRSRLNCASFHSCATFASLSKASAPGQIDYQECLQIRHLLESIQDKNLYLIGFMGTGKSSVALSLRSHLGLDILEMDETIEKEAGCSISEIFATKGEQAFRDMETDLLKRCADQNRIVSCGGGIILRDENIQIMKESGIVICLEASPNTILERLENDHSRPLLENKKTLKEIEAIMDARREQYKKATDIVVDTDERSIDSIAKEIIEKTVRFVQNAQ